MFNVFVKLKWFFKQYRKQYMVAITLLMLASVIEVLPPWILGEAIDAMTNGTMDSTLLMQYMAFILIAAVLSYALNFFWQYQLFGGSIALDRILRKN